MLSVNKKLSRFYKAKQYPALLVHNFIVMLILLVG